MFKFIAFFLYIGMMGAYAESYSQNISVNIQKGKLSDLFKEIQKQTDYAVFYNDQLTDKSITLVAKDKSVIEVLKEVSTNTNLEYKIDKKQILILPGKAVAANRAQDSMLTVRGRVFDTNESPNPLPGVTVIVKGTTRGVSTDAQGYYNISVRRGETLVFSMVSFKSQEYMVNRSQNNLTIALQEDISSLEEVVVVGMTEMQRKHIASSVASLDISSNVEGKPITNLSQSLQGGVTGLRVQQGSGLPGEDGANIIIRGIGTLNNADPLILVDGVPMDMNHIDPVTVESITVLKDAAAAAIYGARAANGVILVTTKRGVPGRVSVTYDGYAGAQTPNILPEFVDAPTYMRMYNYAQVASGGQPFYPEDAIQKTESGEDPINFPNTNWTKEVIDEYTPITSHSLSVSGGNEIARFAVTGNYIYQKGMLPVNEMDRFNVRANTSISLGKKFLINLDVMGIKRNTLYPNRSLDHGGNRMLDDLYRLPPTVLPKYPAVEGFPTIYGRYADIVNPIAYAEQGGFISYEYAQNSINLQPKWEVMPGLNIRGQFSFRLNSDVYKQERDNFYFFDYHTQQLLQTWALQRNAYSETRDTYYYLGASADYTYSRDEHTLFTLAGYSMETENVGYWDKSALMSTYLKTNYAYDDRYLLEASIRMDGSSKFGPGKKFGYFPAFALGWNVHNEGFFSLDAISNLKLRASYGQLGNENIGLYRYQNLINASNGLESIWGNADITWEKVSILDIGADIGLFNNAVEVVVDYYDKITDDIILFPSVAPSGAIGTAPLNSGKVQNKGFELSVNYSQRVNNDLGISLRPGLTYNKNKILDLYGGPFLNGININEIGHPIGSYFGYRTDGILQFDNFEADLKTADVPVITGQQGPGDIKYMDLDGNGIIDANDQEIIGDPTPKLNYFANASARWKAFDFEILLQGTGNHDYSGNLGGKSNGYLWHPINLSASGGVPTTYRAANTWTENNMDAKYPRILANPEVNILRSDFWLFNAAYMRVKYMQLGYTVNRDFLQRKGIQSARFYINAQNPFTVTSIVGADPETQGGSWTYGLMQTYTVGVHITL